MEQQARPFLPAAGHDFALPLYDPLVRLIGGDRVRRVLLEEVALESGQRALDIGCGTGTLVVWLKQQWPNAEVVGLDPDARALEQTARKAERAGVAVRLDRGFADALPYEEASFDLVFSSYMLHHLTPLDADATLREVRRVLKPGASVHLLDFEVPPPGKHHARQRFLHRRDSQRPHVSAGLGALLRAAGFQEVVEVARRSLLFRRVTYFRAVAPS